MAIKENASGLEKISGERIWMELKKILEGNYAGDIMIKILELGLSPYIGLSDKSNINELIALWKRSKHLKMNAITLLSSLLNNQYDVVVLNNRLKLSAFERDLAFFLVEHREMEPSVKPLLPLQKLVLKSKSKPSDAKLWCGEVLKYNNSQYLNEFMDWNIPKFPVTGHMLQQLDVDVKGRFMGKVLNDLKIYWADNDFNFSDEELLKHAPHVISVLKAEKK